MPAKFENGWKLDDYKVDSIGSIMTPALAVYPDLVRKNVDTTLALFDGNPDRWRPHVKTGKLRSVIRVLVDHGVENFKCATSLELLEACRAGAKDVLVAYPVVGPNAERVAEIAKAYPSVRISVLVESVDQVRFWKSRSVSLFLDINPGMDRTGVPIGNYDELLGLARYIASSGIELRGAHYYEGHLCFLNPQERISAAHRCYDLLMEAVERLAHSGIFIAEVVTSGTAMLPCVLSYRRFRTAAFRHRASPGTVVYWDMTSDAQLCGQYAFQPAVVVLSRVVSRPSTNIVTCDAGHKSVSADMGIPNCMAIGRPELVVVAASEEHLTIRVSGGQKAPNVGEVLYLVPRHVCPTVNNFAEALIVENGQIIAAEPVLARGHESIFGAREIAAKD